MKSTIPKDEHEATKALSRPDAQIGPEDRRLAYWRFGRGPDVVLIHGWPLHAATFRRIIPALAKSFTLHLFDLPGVGHSRAHGPASFTSHARAVRGAIDALGLETYALLAHDSGAVIARLVAAGDPRVRALVMAGTEIPGHRPAMFETIVRLAKLPGFGALALAGLRVGALRRSSFGFGGCFTDPRYTDGDFATLFLRPLIASRRAADGHLALLRALDFAFIDTLDEVHARIDAPVMCVWGTDDPFFPIAKARSMLRQFARRGAELAEIPGAKLFAHEDHPEAFVAHVAPFLERTLGAPGAVRPLAQR